MRIFLLRPVCLRPARDGEGRVTVWRAAPGREGPVFESRQGKVSLEAIAMYELKRVIRDGLPLMMLKCPGCGTWGDLDDDQFYGRVSTQCPMEGCMFHETEDFSKIFVGG